MTALSWRDPEPILRPRSIGIIDASPSARWVQIFLEQIPQAGAGEHAGRLRSVEVNPLIVRAAGRGVTAVDARLVLG